MTEREKLLAMAEYLLTQRPCCSCCGGDQGYEDAVVEALALVGLKAEFRDVYEDVPVSADPGQPARKKKPWYWEGDWPPPLVASQRVRTGRRGFLL